MPQAILELKLGRPYEMPWRRLDMLLEQARLDCCIARNAAMTHWFLWRRQHPEWVPGVKYAAPAPRINRKPKPVDPSKPAPKDPPHAPREFLSRELYAVASAAAPKLNTSVCSSCVQEVNSRLRAKTPYNHDGVSRFVWEAILAAEVSLPTWRQGRIPIPRSVTLLHADEAEAWIRFPLLSKQSGYRVLSPRVRVHVADLSGGRRHIWLKLAAGDWRLADSQIIQKDGEWYAQLCYEHPSSAACDSERELTLRPSEKDAAKPFRLDWTDDDGQPQSVLFGKAVPLVAEYRRIQARRRALRYRYRDGTGSGHGKRRYFKILRPLERAVRDTCARWQKQFVSDVIKLAQRVGCGAILYREPSMPLRERGFFAAVDVPFDWTQFLGRLKFKAEVSGLAWETTRIGMGEWRGDSVEEPETADV